MRATTIDGTGTYQDNRWTSLGGAAFTFDFDAGSGISVTHTIVNPGDTPVNEGSYTTASTSTRDNYSQGAGDGGSRIFTFSHQSVEGFRYGNQIGGSTAADSFMYGSWPAPYTEVYIPYDVPAQGDISFKDLAASNVTATAAWPYATSSTNLTGLWLVWDTSDKGDTNVLDWTGSSGDMGARSAGEVTGNATNLIADTRYTFRFYGEDSAVPTNGWSKAGTFATALTAAETPVFTSTTSSFSTVTLEWNDNADTETGYVLRRSTNDVDYAVVATLDADTTSHEDGGLTSEITYYYQLAATNDANGSGTAFASCTTNATTPFMPLITSYDGSDGNWNNDDWNNPANWDNGVPSASQSAVILAGETPSVKGGGATPAYDGTLTIGSNATLHVYGDEDLTALGTNVVMQAGAKLVLVNETYAFSTPINLEGAATIKLSESTTGHHTTKTFNGAIDGGGPLTLEAGNNNTFRFAVSNSFDGVTFPNAPVSRLYGDVAGSLGVGDVSMGNKATVLIQAEDAMADSGTLSLSGIRDTRLNVADAKVAMNANDTVDLLYVDGFNYPDGTYGRIGRGGVDYEYAFIGRDAILTVSSDTGDTTAPTVDFVDDQGGGTIWPGQPVTITVTFGKPLVAGPTTNDFENTTSTGIELVSVTAVPTVVDGGYDGYTVVSYDVVVKALRPGTLKLGLKAGVALEDLFGNAVAVPVADDDTLPVVSLPLIEGELGRWKPWANGGINPSTGAPWAVGDTYHLAFVSSGTRDATDPLIATCHAFVQDAAEAAGIGDTTWYCIAQTWSNQVRDANAPPMVSPLCILLADGITKLADDGPDLANGPDHTFSITEIETSYSSAVATGSTRKPGDPTQSKIEHGVAWATDGRWWQQYNGQQANQWHWYAISDVLTIQRVQPDRTVLIVR